MNCERARRLMDDLADGRLAPSDEPGLREHAASCPGCSSELVLIEAFCQALTASFREARPHGSLKDRVLAALPDEPPRRAPSGLARRRWLSFAAVAAAVAAAGAVAASYLIAVRPPADPATPAATPTMAEVGGAENVAPREEVGAVAFGAVQLRAPDDERFLDAGAGRKLYAGDVVRAAGDAPAEVVAAEGVRIILDAGGEIVLAPDADRPRSVKLTRGQLFADVEKGPGPFSVLTHLGVVTTLGTEFCVDLGEEGALAVTVAEGAVQVDREGEREVVTAGACWLSRTGGAEGAGCERGEACRRRLGWVEQFRRRRRARGEGEGGAGPGQHEKDGRERRQGRHRRSRDGQSTGSQVRPEGARHGHGR